ncbi:phage tail protein I [Faucicola boevrei]|uniref:phage tail protein I n=1 Tax=Faucicola boevrei TaxID=346665 RepID=UPI0003755F9D|nr:phage tail protein I [Moraxella boevrei]
MNISPMNVNLANPPISTERAVSLLPANATKLEHSLASITAKIEPIPVPFFNVWDVDNCPDEFLPYLATAWSVDEWNDNWTADTKRAVIKNSLWVHERKGTLGAVKRALSAMQYDTKIIEWWQKNPQGRGGTFSIEVAPTTGVIADSILQIKNVIDAVKRLSAHYDVYIGVTTLANIHAGGVSLVGVEFVITN